MYILWLKDKGFGRPLREQNQNSVQDGGRCLCGYLLLNWPPSLLCIRSDAWKYSVWKWSLPACSLCFEPGFLALSSRISENWQQKHYDSSFNVSVSFHDQGGVELPQAAVRMFVSFEEFSVLFWIDTAALPSHPHFQLPQTTSFHPHRLHRAPPLHNTSQLEAGPLWPEIRTHAPQSTPPPSSHSLNHWTQSPLHSQQPQDTLWPQLQVGVLQGQHTRRSHLSLMLEMKVRWWTG